MIKKFLEWVHSKIYIDEKPRGKIIHMCEVYWCALGENIGDEENGKGDAFTRPVLIIKKFNNNIFWGIPMSTKLKDNKYYIRVILKNTPQSVMISQLRVLDVKRLEQYIGYISRNDFHKVRSSLIEVLSDNI